MIATILTNKTIQLSNITVWEENIVDERFSATKPNARFIDLSGGSSWDGVYRKYNKVNKTLARPLLDELQVLCKEKDLTLSVQDFRQQPKYKPIDISLINEDFLPGIKLKQFQIDAIKTIYTSEVGTINVSMGGGKSELIAAFCKTMQCPTVIIAEQIQVIDQLRKRLSIREVHNDPGLFYAGKMPNGQLIIIGSIQSLVKPSKKPEEPELKNFKDSKSGTAQKKFEKAHANYEIKLKAYRSRCKKAELLHKLIGSCEMLLIDECVHEDTWIATDRGVMRAKKLYDLIITGQAVKAKVGINYYPIVAASDKLDHTTRVITNTRRELICSANHPIATFDGFRRDKEAKMLGVGDLILTPRGKLPPSTLDQRSIWYHLGLFIGDGHLLNRQQVKFGVRKDRCDWSAICDIIAQQWDGACTQSTNSRGDLTLRIHSKTFCDWLIKLGFKPGRKMGSIVPQFTVPSIDAANNIICGLFDSEGSNYGYKATFTSTDLALVDFVQVLLSYLGIGSSKLVNGTRKNKKHKTCYKLLVVGENYVKFMKIVGFGFSRKRIGMEYQNVKDSERYIDPKPYIAKWLKSGIKKKCLYKLLGYSPSRRTNNISLKRLITWQKLILEYCSSIPETYREANNKLGISYEKIANYHNLCIMTAWNRVTKKNLLWREYVISIISALRIPIVDVNLDAFAVECITSTERSDVKSRLIDFKVVGAESFEANGFLVHNCDLASGDTYKKLFRYWFNGRRRYGFTGTPYDQDRPVENLVLQEHLGSIIYSQNREDVERAGLTIPISYYTLAFGEDGNKTDASAFDIAVNDLIVNNEKLHQFIASLCKRFTHEGTLILVERDDLGYALQNLIPDSAFIHGKTSKKERPKILADFESRKLKVLIGGKNVRRGMDLKGGCENLILATGGKLSSEFKQRIGRAARINAKGSARVFDLYFLNNKYLYAHSRKRLKAAVEAGYTSKVVFNTGSVEGGKFIKSRFRKPKAKSKNKDLPGQKRLF